MVATLLGGVNKSKKVLKEEVNVTTEQAPEKVDSIKKKSHVKKKLESTEKSTADKVKAFIEHPIENTKNYISEKIGEYMGSKNESNKSPNNNANATTTQNINTTRKIPLILEMMIF